MVKKPSEPPKQTTGVISFRLASDFITLLEREGAKQRDETGLPLNASGMARRLVLAALMEPDGKQKKA
jgi:hypothetical protein